MKILMISTDRKIFEEGSDVRERMIEYGKLFDELHIVIFRRRNKNWKPRTGNMIKISENVFIYPTDSINKLFYIFDAIKIGKRVFENLKFKIHLSGGQVENSRNNFVISCQDPFETGLVGWLLARKFKVRLQLQIHTDFLNARFVGHRVSNKFNKVRVMFARFLLPKADCIRVVSNRIKDSLVEKLHINEKQILVLPIFVDIEKIKNTLITADLHKKYPQFKKIILMVSRFEKEKNIPLAISAMREILDKNTRVTLVDKNTRVTLVIAGSGSEEENLKSQVSKLKLQNNIIFEGWQDKETIYSYYKTADLFLVTSDYEGYGMTIIEALASGLPVLSTNVGVAREAGAYITERNNITENIVKYIEKSAKTAKLVNYPYKNKQEYLKEFKKSFDICAKIQG